MWILPLVTMSAIIGGSLQQLSAGDGATCPPHPRPRQTPVEANGPFSYDPSQDEIATSALPHPEWARVPNLPSAHLLVPSLILGSRG